jgi:simple sugar transport system ATP-binding protein
VRDGIAYVTEDRKVEGFFETMSIARNIYLGCWPSSAARPFFLSRGEAVGRNGSTRSRSGDRPRREGRRAVGRQPAEDRHRQIAGQEPDLIVFDEPTRGVDVGAIAEIHQLIDRLADEGNGRGGDLVLPARDHGAVGPHPGLPAGQGRGGILGARGHRGKIMYAAIH